MPKSAKKRRDKAADFSKAKLKLGKGKKLADNAIDTSFKARSIALPTQSIAIDKDEGAPTTRRRLTFEDLIAHAKHYSASTRKDALLGLRELLEGHPELVESSLTVLLNACVRIIGDEDASVRKTLLSFLAWLLPRIPIENLIPHSPLLILFTTSAQTHIFPEIRIDAVRFLDLFLEIMPATIVSGWTDKKCHGNRVLEGYLGILNAGTKFGETDGPMKATSSASVTLSPGSKAIVLKSLSTFLKHALSSPNRARNTTDASIPTWFLLPSFECQEAYESFEGLLQPQAGTSGTSKRWQPEVDIDANEEDFAQNFNFAIQPFGNQWSLQDLSDIVNQTGAISEVDALRSVDTAFVTHLARTLQSTMIATFLDCAPVIFSPTSGVPGSELSLVAAMADTIRSLYGAIFRESTSDNDDIARTDLKTLLGYMSTYFPFRPNMASRDIKIEQIFQDLNLIYCELTSLLILASNARLISRPNRGKGRQTQTLSQTQEGVLSLQVGRACEYVTQLLRGEASTASQISRPIPNAAYRALLPIIWSLLNQTSLNDQRVAAGVLEAALEHATTVSSISAVKKSSVEFLARLVLLETDHQYHGSFKVGRMESEVKKFEDWIVHLPKVLWELGDKNLSTTEAVLRFLLRLLQRKSCLVNSETIASLGSRLVPYFTITHPTRGQLPGPYTRLPDGSPIRRLALDVVATILMSSAEAGGLIEAVGVATVDTEEVGYWGHLRTVIR
ncbi:hypothetical protein FIBSPDRAFT_945334 [Athelia psychrophila]|uniref:Pre-rRNA-processing protein n=1 Tax=Athelia psychrophila TaxID=1759441 RepID=A0A166U4X8_9AGAM|nr:hypothetical protein FIBSPDRAFT_945334 [Fibularhizoctonia sp. CBS 109695]